MEVSRINIYQVIQFVTFLSRIVGGHLTIWRGHVFAIPKWAQRDARNMIFTTCACPFCNIFFASFSPLSPFWSVYSPVTWGNSLNKKVKEKNAGNATRWASLPSNHRHHKSIWAMRKRAPGCLGCIGDDILPNYMGILISLHKDPYKPTRIQWKVVRIFSVAHL